MSAEPQVQIVVSKETRFLNFAVSSIDPLPAGGMEVSFIVPQTGELLVFPLNQEAAEKLGRALLAPSVVVPNGNGLGAG